MFKDVHRGSYVICHIIILTNNLNLKTDFQDIFSSNIWITFKPLLPTQGLAKKIFFLVKYFPMNFKQEIKKKEKKNNILEKM